MQVFIQEGMGRGFGSIFCIFNTLQSDDRALGLSSGKALE